MSANTVDGKETQSLSEIKARTQQEIAVKVREHSIYNTPWQHGIWRKTTINLHFVNTNNCAHSKEDNRKRQNTASYYRRIKM